MFTLNIYDFLGERKTSLNGCTIIVVNRKYTVKLPRLEFVWLELMRVEHIIYVIKKFLLFKHTYIV